MSRRLKRIESLMRMRKRAHDLATVELGEARRDASEADALCAARIEIQERVAREQERFLSRRPKAPLLAATVAGERRIRALSAEAGETAKETREDLRGKQAALECASQSLKSVEKLHRRVLDLRRQRRLRIEANRIDEAGARSRAPWKSVLLLAALVLLSIPPVGHAEGTTEKSEQVGVAGSLSAIRIRQAELDVRERELIDREESLGVLEKTVVEKLAELERLSERVGARIAAWEEAEGGKSIGRLSRIYAEMKPDQAARLLATLDIELATQIVAKMKPKKSSALLAQVERERARRMSELIAHPLSMEPAVAPEDRS